MIPKPKLLETLVCTVAGSDVQLRKTFVPKTHRFFYRYLTCNYTVTFKPGLGLLKVIVNNTDRSAAYDFLLTFHYNRGSIS